MMNVRMAKRAYFHHNGQRWCTIENTAGGVEIYWVDPSNGIEMFRGYWQDQAIPASLRLKVAQVLYTPDTVLDFQHAYQIEMRI